MGKRIRPASIWIQFEFVKLTLDYGVNSDFLQARVVGRVSAMGTDVHSKKEGREALLASPWPKWLPIGHELAFYLDISSTKELGYIQLLDRINATLSPGEAAQARIMAYRNDWRSFTMSLKNEPEHSAYEITILDFSTETDSPKGLLVKQGQDLIADVEANANK